MQRITRIKSGGANCFCLEQNGNAILIDTGWNQHRDIVLAACKGKNIRLIVLTHGHIDHIQNAAALSKALFAPIAMHKADVGLIADNTAQPFLADTLLGKAARFFTR